MRELCFFINFKAENLLREFDGYIEDYPFKIH